MNLSRRRFLQTAAGLSAGTLLGRAPSPARAAEPTLADLDAAAARPVLKRELFDTPVVIDSLRLLKKGSDHFVHVRSKDGAEGIALTNERGAYLYPIFNKLVAPYFPGKDARDLEEHIWEVYRFRSNYKLQGIALWCPVAWIEFAILDMLGRIAGKSIGELLGTIVRRDVPFYVASGNRDTTPEEEVEYLGKLLEETGGKAVKFRVGGRMSRNADSMPGRTEKLITLSRKVLDDDIAIHADSNSSYDPPEAVRFGRLLEDIGAVYFEEPCPFDHLEDTKVVTDTLTIPVAGGEQEYSERRFRWAIANRGVDIVQPDLQYYGGLIRSTRVARMAQLAGMPTTVHISGGFGFIYMLHFASFTPEIGLYQEYKRNIQRYRDWFEPALTINNGALRVPDGPGVGIRNVASVLDGAEEVK
ncbi:MAG: mandelate racemase/muconate lactonizing enzyme family protein [Planctomycetaceae bacterium]|nr:mandelate racemase/muconate lactonizing enzyme family protein [Planctomycetaceae bacterium]